MDVGNVSFLIFVLMMSFFMFSFGLCSYTKCNEKYWVEIYTELIAFLKIEETKPYFQYEKYVN
jgi:hypothetical protein